MMASKAIKPVYDVFKERGFNSMSRSLCRRFQAITPTQNRPLTLPAVQQFDPRSLLHKDAFKKAGLDPEQPPKTWQIWRTMPQN